MAAFRPLVVGDEVAADQFRQQLVDRVGSLSWVVEGAIQSIAVSDLDAATRLWGDEVIDLLWEREMLVSPDGNPNHREVRLSDDVQAWASARRAELVFPPTPPRQTSSPLDHLALTPRPTERQDARRNPRPVMAGTAP